MRLEIINTIRAFARGHKNHCSFISGHMYFERGPYERKAK